MSTRLFVADDHTLFRRGVRALLEGEAGFEVVGEAGNGDALLPEGLQVEFDVLLLDISMPGPPASHLIQHIRKAHSAVEVLVLTMHDEEYYLREMLQSGAKGFLLKSSTADELASAIRSVARGDLYVDPALSHVFVPPFIDGKRPRKSAPASLLTGRELEVLRFIALGHTNREIADQLCISKRTVESHRANIIEKVGATSRAELVGYARSEGLLEDDGFPGG